MISNLLSKLMSGASNIANRAEDSLMPAPADGLFSQQDLAAARKQGLLHLGMSLLGDTSGMGLGSALKNGAQDAEGAYSGSLQNAQAQQAALKQKQLLATRQQIMQKYAPQPGDSPSAMINRLPGAFSELMGAGDSEGAKALQGVVEHLADKDAQPGKAPQTVQLGDRVVTFNPGAPAGQQYTDASGKVITDLSRHQTPEEVQEHKDSHQVALAQIQAARDAHDAMQGQQAGRAFMTQNSDLVKSETAYASWKAALAAAQAGNPEAYKSALVNFAGAADSKAQLRLGTLQYLSKIDPSVAGNFNLAMNKLASGKYPPQVLQGMDQVVSSMHKNNVDLFNKRRTARVKAHPSWDSYIPTTEETFPTSVDGGTGNTTPNAGTSRVGQFLKGFGAK